MGEDSSLERRRAYRATVSIAVEISDPSGFTLHSTRDVSVGGVFFDRAIPHKVGSRVQLSFQLPGDPRNIRCDGEVVNVPDKSGYGMGVRFSNVAPADQQRLEEFIQEMMGAAP
jgi:uncharacterized protein (TIGR02266 family)